MKLNQCNFSFISLNYYFGVSYIKLNIKSLKTILSLNNLILQIILKYVELILSDDKILREIYFLSVSQIPKSINRAMLFKTNNNIG